MAVVRVLLSGAGDALASPRLLIALWLLLLLVALPAGVLIEESIRGSIGASRVEESLRQGLDLGWLGEYQSRARGLEKSVRVSMVGRGAVLDNLESWFDGRRFLSPPSAVFGGVYALLWLFLLGGVLERFARRQRRFVLAPFLAAAARFFPRLLGLTLISGVLYFAVYRLAWWLFPWIERLTRELTVERTVLAAHLGGAVVILILLASINLVFGYAKIAVVFEGRRGFLGALLRAARFVARHPGRTIGLYLCLAAVGVLLIGLYAAAAPGVGQSTAPGIAAAFLVGQVYLLARLALRLTFFSAQMRLYESERFGGSIGTG